MAENLTSFRMFLSEYTGNAQNTLYEKPVEITNAEELAAACRNDHVCTEYTNNYRSSENFIRCFAIQADCDNDNTEDPAAWITPETVAERLPGIAFYAVTSRHNNKIKHEGKPDEHGPRPRWHYYFMLRQGIPDIYIIRQIMARLLVVFPEFDKKAMKPAQFLFGHAEPFAEYHPGKQDIAEFFVSHPEIKVSVPDPAAEPAEKPERIQAATGSETDFITMNAPDMLSKIPADDYETWIDIGMALKAAGCDISLWDEWSKTSSKYPGYNAIVKKWNSFKRGGKGPGTLVYNATLNGWKPDPAKLTGEYKENYEAAEKTRIERAAKHRERVTAALAAAGLSDTAYSDSLSVTYNFDGSVYQIIDTESSDIIYTGVKVNEANPAAAKPAIKDEKQKVPSLETFDADYFNNTEIIPPEPIIDKILYPGLGMLGSPAKMGKSYMMLQLAACIATGQPFMDFEIKRPGPVLYMDLQGTKARTMKRLNSMGYKNMPQGITLTYKARKTDNGLIEQLTEWIEKTGKPSLIIIDMLEQVKGSQRRTEDAYRADNRILEPLHEIALKYDLSVLCVMHTRKGNKLLPDDDPYNEIIGSIGQFGSADCCWMIIGKRNDDNKRFSTICRDNDDGQQDYEACFVNHRWSIAGTVEDCAEKRALEDYNNNPIVYTLRKLIQESGGGWNGTMKDLITEIAQRTKQYPAATPEKMTKLISELEYRLSCEGIEIQRPTSSGGRNGRRYRFYTRQPEQDEMDL